MTARFDREFYVEYAMGNQPHFWLMLQPPSTNGPVVRLKTSATDEWYFLESGLFFTPCLILSLESTG